MCPPPSSFLCRHCDATFGSRNELFRHLASVGLAKGRGKKRRYICFQVGYHSNSAWNVDAGLQELGIQLSPRIGSPVWSGSAWCDVVSGWEDATLEWNKAKWLNHDFILDACVSSGPMTIESAVRYRVEVMVPHHVVYTAAGDDDDDKFSMLRSLREVAHELFCGQRSWHAFGDVVTRPPCPRDRGVAFRVSHVTAKDEDGVIIVALTMAGLLRRMASRAVALAVAVYRGWLTMETAHLAFSDDDLFFLSRKAPVPPASLEALASVSFGRRETVADVVVDALRRRDDPDAVARVHAFRNAVRQSREDDFFWDDFEVFARRVQRDGPSMIVPRPQEPPKVFTKELATAYDAALAALRCLAKDGWPPTTAARGSRLRAGGSFTVGATRSQATPKQNRLTSVVKAVAELERAIIATGVDREPSTQCAVNCGAQFLPHVDHGSAGEGQSKSLIVALGDFQGGDLVIEGNDFDIRYKPLEFDGSQRHWTRPFTGQRFSLVWFTSDEVEDMDVPQKPGPPPPDDDDDQEEEEHLELVAPQQQHDQRCDDVVRRRRRIAWALEASVAATLPPGVVHLRGFVDPNEAAALLRVLNDVHLSFRRVTYANGQTLNCRTACLGRRWDPVRRTYRKDDVPAIPSALQDLARRSALACADVDPRVLGQGEYKDPDVVLANFYDDVEDAGMGLHQDTDESPEVLKRGLPVISVSFGADAVFVLAPEKQHHAKIRLRLSSGDVLAFGGPSRLIFHGVEKVAPFIDSTLLAMRPGRLSLTFRRSHLSSSE